MPYPEEIGSDEPIVRVIREAELNASGEVRPNAFRPRKGTADLSVVRWCYVDPDPRTVKALVKRIGFGQYAGLARLRAEQCSAAGADPVDARDEYDGHAHLHFPVVNPGGDNPAEGEAFRTMTSIADELLEACTYFEDPNADSEEWTIADLPPPAPIPE